MAADDDQRFFDNHAEKHEAHEELARERWDAHAEKHAGEKEREAAKWESHDDQHESIARNLREYKEQSNEWRGSLSDLRATFAPLVRVDAIDADVDRLRDEMRGLIATERDERRRNESEHALTHRGDEGVKKGLSTSVAIIVGAITLAVTILGAIILVANFATGTPVVT
ncbi:MAG TPA: hypothetical protein VEW95_05535 [Candidatus Limnocylindrales bacterium]|nr:hypothetical protein [Candidatus Limnocylindrales bacterium]